MTKSVRAAVAFSILGNYGGLIITFILMIVVSRILPPAEVGAFVVTFALITTLDNIREFNISSYVVQAQAISDQVLRSAFGLALAVTGLVSFAIILLHRPLAAMVGATDFGQLLLIMMIGLLVSPFTSPALGMMNREMQFRQLMVLRVVSALGRAAISIFLLFWGLGVTALAWGFVASRVAELAVVAAYRAPGIFILPSFRGVMPIAGFGLRATSVQLVSTFGVTMADMATGRFLGLSAAALYDRGSALVRMYRTGIEAAVLPVAFSTFAREQRSPEGDLTGVYLRGLSLLTVTGWPAFAVLGVLAEPLILVFFGSPWAAGAQVAQILAFGGAVYALSAPTGKLLIAIGRIDALLKRELLIQIPRIIMVLIAAQISITMVAWAIVGTYALALVVNQSILSQSLAISYMDLWRSSKASLLVAVVVLLFVWLAAELVDAAGATTAVTLSMGCTAAVISWGMSVHLTRHPARDELLVVLRRLRSVRG